MEAYVDLAKELGADLAIWIDPSTVVTAPWTAFKCQYGCDFYGKNWCCPPKSPDYKRTREILDSYQKGLLFRCGEPGPDVKAVAVELSRRMFLDGYYKAIAFGSGPCGLCAQCDPNGCRFPKKAIPAMEACGIDVFATVRANGQTLKTLRERSEPHWYFGLVLAE